ncbi:hypothetical protein AKO1_000036 [Acrasis kona]|uniref:Uncharacterized protein n=1 Tax=Acrasis kona TaxID=1008807 RepID=A0AAW2ZEP7_9EUKA
MELPPPSRPPPAIPGQITKTDVDHLKNPRNFYNVIKLATKELEGEVDTIKYQLEGMNEELRQSDINLEELSSEYERVENEISARQEFEDNKRIRSDVTQSLYCSSRIKSTISIASILGCKQFVNKISNLVLSKGPHEVWDVNDIRELEEVISELSYFTRFCLPNNHSQLCSVQYPFYSNNVEMRKLPSHFRGIKRLYKYFDLILKDDVSNEISTQNICEFVKLCSIMIKLHVKLSSQQNNFVKKYFNAPLIIKIILCLLRTLQCTSSYNEFIQAVDQHQVLYMLIELFRQCCNYQDELIDIILHIVQLFRIILERFITSDPNIDITVKSFKPGINTRAMLFTLKRSFYLMTQYDAQQEHIMDVMTARKHYGIATEILKVLYHLALKNSIQPFLENTFSIQMTDNVFLPDIVSDIVHYYNVVGLTVSDVYNDQGVQLRSLCVKLSILLVNSIPQYALHFSKSSLVDGHVIRTMFEAHQYIQQIIETNCDQGPDELLLSYYIGLQGLLLECVEMIISQIQSVCHEEFLEDYCIDLYRTCLIFVLYMTLTSLDDPRNSCIHSLYYLLRWTYNCKIKQHLILVVEEVINDEMFAILNPQQQDQEHVDYFEVLQNLCSLECSQDVRDRCVRFNNEWTEIYINKFIEGPHIDTPHQIGDADSHQQSTTVSVSEFGDRLSCNLEDLDEWRIEIEPSIYPQEI